MNLAADIIDSVTWDLPPPVARYLPTPDPQPQNPWCSMDHAPKNATWVDVLLPDRTMKAAHWACGGGEEQPPFEGWFKAVHREDGSISYFSGLPDPIAWRKLTLPK